MGLEKAIKSGKEKRKPYRKAKAIDASCRNHGRCPHCTHSRQHFDTKARLKADINNEDLDV